MNGLFILGYGLEKNAGKSCINGMAEWIKGEWDYDLKHCGN
jgi:hypothetical protein